MLMTAQEMIEEQRANCGLKAVQILMAEFMPELKRAAKMPSLRQINVFIKEDDQLVIGSIVRSLRDAGYRVEVNAGYRVDGVCQKLCFTLGW